MAISPDCNFIFLEEGYPHLAEGACIAESCIYIDPHNSIMKIGLLNEEICRLICKKRNIEIGKKDNFAKIVQKLKKNIFFTDEDAETYIKIEKIANYRNMAAHNLPRSEEWHRKYTQIAEQSVLAGYVISTNFYSRFEKPGYQFPPYHSPGKQPVKPPKDETSLDNVQIVYKDGEYKQLKFRNFIEHDRLKDDALRKKKDYKDDRDDDGLMSPTGKKITKGIMIGAGLVAAPLLLPFMAIPVAGAIATASVAAKGACVAAGGAALAAAGLGKATGILPDSINQFFGSLNLSDLDIDNA